MSSKSDEGLQHYIDNRSKFTPEAVEAAIAEMQNRGRTFSDEELNLFRNEFASKKEAALNDMEMSWRGSNWKKNVVEDESAPAYYSEKAIYMFSVIFSMIFGAILSAINFSKLDNKHAVMEVIGFGVGYTALEFWILSQLERTSGLTLVFNIGGALLLRFFWYKHIGKDTKYRAKPIWVPLIIAIAVTAMVLLTIIYGGGV